MFKPIHCMALLGLIGLPLGAGLALASNCRITTVNRTPINDLGAGLYLNQFQGGLYPGGSNTVPAAHAAIGLPRAASVAPLNPLGQPTPPTANGKYVLLSVGMSNTSLEFTRMQQLAASNPLVNHSKLVLVNGAQGGQDAGNWQTPDAATFDIVRDARLTPWGLSEAQVQAVWIKQANGGANVGLPNAAADAFEQVGQLGNIVRNVKIRYPNVKVVFLSSRIYAGYATGVSTLNPEPYAYEGAFAVKWLIEAQINQINGGGTDPNAGNLDCSETGPAPWIAWGPYLWADGLTPRSDGLIWQCEDFMADGTHPLPIGQTKAANLIMNFFLGSPFTETWFQGRVGDATDDGVVDVNDLLMVINNWGPCPAPCPARCSADVAPVAGNCVVNVNDLLAVINNWG